MVAYCGNSEYSFYLFVLSTAAILCLICVTFILDGYSVKFLIQSDEHRKLSSTYLPEKDKYFEFSGKKVANTTSIELPKLFFEVLSKRLQSGNDTKKPTLSSEEISLALNSLEKDLGWNSTLEMFVNKAPLLDAYHGVNYFDHVLKQHEKLKSHAERKRLEESLSTRFEKNHDTRSIDTMYDVIVLTGNATSDIYFLEKWREWIVNMHVIVIQQGDSERLISIPSWLEYELYTKVDAEKAIGAQHLWMFDFDSDGPQAANFGFLVSDRDLVFLVDRFSIPRVQSSASTSSFHTNMLHNHAKHLLKPSMVFYFQNPNNNPFTPHSDFLRGYPFSLREGIQTAVSIGEVLPSLHSSEHDYLTKLFKDQHLLRATPHRALLEAGNDSQFTQMDEKDLAIAVPLKNLFSLTISNVAFNRKILGPALFFLHAASSKMDFPVHQNFDVLFGWILKVLGDHVGFGVKHILSPTYLYSSSERGRSSWLSSERVFIEKLKGDLMWIQHHEEIVRFFSTLELSERVRNDVGDALNELIQKLKAAGSTVHPILGHVADMMATYKDIWNRRNAFDMKILPVASRSQKGPQPGSVHKCAAFTIAHNETNMLDVWLRYYHRHLPNALWVLNHLSGDDVEANEIKVDKNRYSGATYVNLYGDRAGEDGRKSGRRRRKEAG